MFTTTNEIHTAIVTPHFAKSLFSRASPPTRFNYISIPRQQVQLTSGDPNYLLLKLTLRLNLVGLDVVQLHVVEHLVRYLGQHALRQHRELQARVAA